MEPLLAERQEQSGWWLWAMGKPELLSAVSQTAAGAGVVAGSGALVLTTRPMMTTPSAKIVAAPAPSTTRLRVRLRAARVFARDLLTGAQIAAVAIGCRRLAQRSTARLAIRGR